MYDFFIVFIGGGIGAFVRLLFTKLSNYLVGFSHCGTFVVNIIGCFFIGLIFGLLAKDINIITPEVKIFLTVGFLGGLTTFSTFNYEVFELIKNGKIIFGITYLFLTCFVGLVSTLVGMCLANKM